MGPLKAFSCTSECIQTYICASSEILIFISSIVLLQIRQLLVIFYSLQSRNSGDLCLKTSGSEMMGCRQDSVIVCTISRTWLLHDGS